MATYNPSPFGNIASPYQPNPYKRYEPYQGNPLAQYANMALGLMGGNAADPGVMDLGMNNQTNLYGNLAYQYKTKQHSRAMMRSYEADTSEYLNVARGAYVTANMKDQFTDQTQKQLLDVHNAAAPLITQFDSPEQLKMYDQAHGGRSRMPMAHAIASTARGWQPGMFSDPDQVGQRSADLASSIHQQFFAGGDPMDFSRSGGLKSHEMADMYQSLAVSGRMPDLESISKTDPKMKKWSQKDAGKKVNDAIGEYAQILGTMKEIFVAEGRTDVPMNQLLQAADSLTGGLQQISRKSAVARIRGIYEAAGKLNLGSEAIVANLQTTSGIAQQYGLNQAFALPMAQYGFEFKAATRGLQDTESWGLRNSDELMVMAQQKQAAFVGSEGGNRIGMLHRLAQRKYGDETGKIDVTKIRGDDPTSKALRALATGQVNDPSLAGLLGSNDREFLNQASSAFGISVNTAAMEQGFTQQNQQQVHKNDLGRFAGGMQGGEFSKMFLEGGGAFGRATDIMVGEMVGSGKQASALSQELTKAAGEALKNMGAENRNDEVTRNAKMATALKKTLEQKAAAGDAGAKEMLKKLSAGEGGLQRGLQTLASQQYAGLENYLIDQGLAPGTLNNEMIMFDKDIQEKVQGENRENTINAQVKASGLGRIDSGGIFDKLAQAMGRASATGEGDAISAIKSVLGQDVTGSQAAHVQKVIQDLKKKEDELAALDEKLKASGEGEDEGVSKQKEKLKASIKQAKDEATKWMESSTSASIREAAKDEKENKEGNKNGKEEDKLSGGGKEGGLSIDSLTIILDGKTLVDNGKVKEIKPTGRGKGPTK